jgi:hypothetical protein
MRPICGFDIFNRQVRMIYVKSSLAGILAIAALGAIYLFCLANRLLPLGSHIHSVFIPLWLVDFVPNSIVRRDRLVSVIGMFIEEFPSILLVTFIFAAGFFWEFRRNSKRRRARLPLA